MTVLDTLREVDSHFQKLTRLDVPEQVRKFRQIGERHYEDRRCEYYDLWRRVRHAIKELERNAGSNAVPAGDASVGRHEGHAQPTRIPNPFPAIADRIAKDEEGEGR